MLYRYLVSVLGLEVTAAERSMKTSKNLLNYCTSICDGDGISPRHEKNQETKMIFDNTKLCHQIQKLSRLAIAELGLGSWDIIKVTQRKRKTSMLLIAAPTTNSTVDECELAIKWLKSHQSEIRNIIANGITRKAVPALHFKLAEQKDYD